ncbi:MAG: zinc ribbon domain-containing protein [Candidatus Methanomethylophilaceae archaeon]|nr:zinc ribbon domain-containing protein [Candidatus Methanomethylophilaceae archaeon]
MTLADRRCPHCGERVPSFSINCPNCYRSIPPEDPPKEEYRIIDDDRAPSVRRVNRKLVAFLAFVPGVFGLFGLGQLYQKDWHKGIMFLLTGILMMASMVMLLKMVGGPVAIILFIGLLILFIGGYLIQAFDAVVRSLFRF